MQASTTLRRSAISKRMVASVIALAAAVALGGAAAFVAKSTVAVQQAPAAERYSLPSTPVCDELVCDVNRLEQAPIPDSGLVQ
jgi:hypothetical protein